MAGLYVHVPFCARRCAYCDFSIAVRGATPVDEYLDALRRELASQSSLHGATLDTLYLGGGTPSRLGGEGIFRAIDTIRQFATLGDSAEITIEANPDDLDDGTAERWLESGVNRVSLGAQSFDDSVLRWMRRTHDAKRIPDAVRVLKRAGIENVSIDLIFSLPGELHRSWQQDLDRALSLDAPHISLYGLTVEPHTPLGRWRDRGIVVEGTEERYEEEFFLAHDLLTGAGFDHYEVSNFARGGSHSQHNSSYWTGEPYFAAGPSAHSFDGITRRWNVSPYAEWVRRLSAGQDVLDGEEILTEANRFAERIYLGLRTSKGLDVQQEEIVIAESWVRAGWASLNDSTLRLTPAGWLRLDSLAADFINRRRQHTLSPLVATPSHCYI